MGRKEMSKLRKRRRSPSPNNDPGEAELEKQRRTPSSKNKRKTTASNQKSETRKRRRPRPDSLNSPNERASAFMHSERLNEERELVENISRERAVGNDRSRPEKTKAESPSREENDVRSW
jgi:hypothetical protein